MTRDKSLDMAKGFAIWCIVFMHYENGILPWQANLFISSFMITTFFVTAGWISEAKKQSLPTKILVKKRWKSLGLPYIYWCGIILAFDSILWLCGYYDSYFMMREVYKAFILRGIGTLWFLPALFFGEVIWNKLKEQKTLVILLMLAIAITYINCYNGFFAGKNDSFWKIVNAPFCVINSIANAIIGISGGFYAHKLLNHLIEKSNRLSLFIYGIVLFCLAYMAAVHLDVLSTFISTHLWFTVSPILGPVGLILTFKSVENLKTMQFLEYWGRNSLSLMVTHYSIVLILAMILVQYVVGSEFMGWITIICFAISIPLQYIIAELLNKYAPALVAHSAQRKSA